jgi:hypothetical protein
MPRKQKTVEEREAEYNGRTNLKARYLPFYPANKVKGTLSANKQKMYDRAVKNLHMGIPLTVGQNGSIDSMIRMQKASK